MKVIKYQVLGYTGVWNPETEEVEQKECLAGMERPYTEEDYQKALAVAYNGEVTIEGELSTQDKIAILKEQLSSTDYKIIKCSEAQLVGEELPYDITALHAERQAIRNQINELEGSES